MFHRFFSSLVCLGGRPVNQFIAELDILLQNLHNTSTKSNQINSLQQHYNITIPHEFIISSQSNETIQLAKKKNYGRLVKRLRHKPKLSNIVLQKTDKSKVFHLGKPEHYQKKSDEYMEKTQAYKCLGTNDPLRELIHRTNRYLLDLRLAK